MNSETYTQDIRYSVPDSWYAGYYLDQAAPCRAARSFSMLHEQPSRECWLIIQGYRGYPGEFVRPASDLFKLGYDVFVPRLPGNGTSCEDFIRSHASDWIGVSRAALEDLKTRYSRVHIVAHSMGAAIALIIAWGDAAVGHIVLACPSFTNTQMPLSFRLRLRLQSLFKPVIDCHWQKSTAFHLHYEGAPDDDDYLGAEYWTWTFTRHHLDYWKVMRQGMKHLRRARHDHLVLCPLLDDFISVPSTTLFRQIVGDEARVAEIPGGTHFVFYDIDPTAEQTAVQAICDYAGPCPE